MVETKKRTSKLPRWDDSLFRAHVVPEIKRSALSIEVERKENRRFGRKTFTLFDMGARKRGKTKDDPDNH